MPASNDSDNLASETTASPSKGKKFALVVGVNNSSTSSYLSDLENAENDALAICWALQQPACKFTSVKLLTADKAKTHNVLDEMIKLIQQKTEQDFLLFYFIGHGQPAKTKEGDRDVYFVTYDFDPHHVSIDKHRHLSMRWLRELLYEIEGVGGILIVLDCCYAGDMITPKTDSGRVRIDVSIDVRKIVDECLGNTTLIHQRDRLRVILTSTRHNTKAQERVLTGLLLPILQGEKIEALDPNTGDVNIHSLFMYLRERMPQEQLPNLTGEFAGNWILASYPEKSSQNLEMARKARENERWNEIPAKVKEQVTEAMSEFVHFLERTDVSSSQSFDHSLCKEASFNDLDLGRVDEFFRRDRLLKQRKVPLDVSDQERLQQFGFLKGMCPTYGALLCFGKDPQHWVSSAVMRCVNWSSNNRFDELQDSEISHGDLLSQFESARNFLRHCLRFTRVIGREGSTEQWEIPFRVLEEALANALVHREYENQNGFVQVQVFSDRVEISSPGAPPSPVTLDNLGLETTSHPRNFQIASIFYLSGYFEQVGSGIPRMRRLMEEARLGAPEFQLSPTKTFKVILSRPKEVPQEVTDFGSELRKIRTRTSLSQATLASSVGVSDVSIRNWESNISKPKAEHLKKLIEVLLKMDAFTKGKELEEVQRLWAQAREDNIRLKAAFDEAWFEELTAIQRRSSFSEEEVRELKIPEIMVQGNEGLSKVFQPGILPGTAPKDITVLPLPPAASGLVGRKEEQAWLESCIFAGKVVEVSGMGGVGKTTLVAATVNKVKDQFQGGVAVIQANEITDPINIVRQLIGKFVPHQQEVLNRPGIRPNQLYDALRDVLTLQSEDRNRVLIVLDNVEPGLIQSKGLQQLCTIFRTVKVSAIITTRPPLSAQLVNEGQELKPFTNEAATDLLTRLLEHPLRRSLTKEERLDAAEICQLVGNHAQAIVLIAAHFEDNEFESLADYLQRLRDRPQIALDLADRLQVVETSSGIRLTFASSYSRLTAQAQHLFVALGTFAGQSCTYRAVIALGAALKQSEDETRANLAALRRAKLVLEPTFDRRGNMRISVHILVHEFARELLRTSSDIPRERLGEVLARHYLEWVQKVDDELLDADDANIMDALRWVHSHPSQEAKVILAELIYLLRWYWYSRFRFQEAFEWLKAGCDAIELLGADFNEMWGELLFALGTQYQQIGEIPDAENCYQKSFELFEELSQKFGLKAGLGEAVSGLAALEQQRGDHDKAQQYYDRSLAIFRELQDQRGEANALFRLGFLALRTGDTDAAERYYTESLNIPRDAQRDD